MTTDRLSRRDLLGTTAGSFAALAALPAMTTLLPGGANASAVHRCIVNHQNLAQNLKTLMEDPNVSAREAAMAHRTCRCIHCDVAIAPMMAD